MIRRGASLYSLLFVLGGWVGARYWAHQPPEAVPFPDHAAPALSHLLPLGYAALLPSRHDGARRTETIQPRARNRIARADPVARATVPVSLASRPPIGMRQPAAETRARFIPSTYPTMATPPAMPQNPSRWSGSAWLLVRERASAVAIATNGQLSGSQLGARLRWRINPAAPVRTTLAATLSSPLSDREAAEAALGAEWYPFQGQPVWLGVERRIALGRNGRSGWSARLAGGFWRTGLPFGMIADGYGQAGFVGMKSRDGFIDGTARLSYPIAGPDGLRAGVAVWGAAQPRVARLDIGPHLTMPVRIARTKLLLSIEGRMRIAGQAAPGSGVALTMGTDF